MRFNKRILCGLDAIWQAHVVAGLLNNGHQVTPVADGRSLLVKLSEGEHFDIVVMDGDLTSATLAQVQARLKGKPTRIVVHTNDKAQLKTTRTESIVFVSKRSSADVFVAEALAQEMAE